MILTNKKVLYLLFLLILAGGLIYISQQFYFQSTNTIKIPQPQKIIVHRSSFVCENQNSSQGINNVIETINDNNDFYLELDISITKDGVLILFHDLNFELDGALVSIRKSNYSEIQESHPSILTLSELLQNYANQSFIFDIRDEVDIHANPTNENRGEFDYDQSNNILNSISAIFEIENVDITPHYFIAANKRIAFLLMNQGISNIIVGERYARPLFHGYVNNGSISSLRNGLLLISQEFNSDIIMVQKQFVDQSVMSLFNDLDLQMIVTNDFFFGLDQPHLFTASLFARLIPCDNPSMREIINTLQ